VTICGNKTLAELLSHLYVLIPVFDNDKHYYVGSDELEKLLDKGQGWLASHPEKELIARRYLRNRSSLIREALARLVEEESADDPEELTQAQQEESLEQTVSLNEQRHTAVVEAVRASGARSVLDLGCGEGKLLRAFLDDRQFERIIGMDVSIRSLEIAQRRLRLDNLPAKQAERIKLVHGSLMYRDQRLSRFDAAVLVEVIEHLDPSRLASLERVVFEFARPQTVVVTTPNQEYNVMWETLPAGQFRHSDHRFEWSRAQFQDWATRVSTQYGYDVRFAQVGPVDATVGSPTQLAVFESRSLQK
jgi:3' terminal RNA ribose 2'-O-methyltransferase Hen1